MSESKLADVESPSLDVKRIVIEPNVCELTAPLGMDVDFTLDRPVSGGVWEIKVGVSCGFGCCSFSRQLFKSCHNSAEIVIG